MKAFFKKLFCCLFQASAATRDNLPVSKCGFKIEKIYKKEPCEEMHMIEYIATMMTFLLSGHVSLANSNVEKKP